MAKRIEKRVKASTSKVAVKHRKEKFAKALVMNGGNQTQAAISAGYSENGAHVAANRLLKDATIAAAVQARRQELMRLEDITTERITMELARIGLSDVRKLHDADGRLLPPSEWDDDAAMAVARIKTDGRTGDRSIDLHDKPSALDKLARIHGMYEKDNRQLKGDLNIQINVVNAKRDAGEDK